MMTEITPHALETILKRYSQEVVMGHMGRIEDHHHQTVAFGMRRVLYLLGLLDDETNHKIVERAKKKANKIKSQAR